MLSCRLTFVCLRYRCVMPFCSALFGASMLVDGSPCGDVLTEGVSLLASTGKSIFYLQRRICVYLKLCCPQQSSLFCSWKLGSPFTISLCYSMAYFIHLPCYDCMRFFREFLQKLSATFWDKFDLSLTKKRENVTMMTSIVHFWELQSQFAACDTWDCHLLFFLSLHLFHCGIKKKKTEYLIQYVEMKP